PARADDPAAPSERSVPERARSDRAFDGVQSAPRSLSARALSRSSGSSAGFVIDALEILVDVSHRPIARYDNESRHHSMHARLATLLPPSLARLVMKRR